MKTRGSFETESVPLQSLSEHHFNSKHSLGVVNWHLPRRGMHKHSFINLSPLTFPLFVCLSQSPPFPLPFPCLLLALLSPSVPLFPFHHPPNPPSLSISPWDYTTYSHEYICVILFVQLRQTYLRILGGMVFVMHPHP